MAFTASVTEFGHTFIDAVVEVTEANLEYRLNNYAQPEGEQASPTTKLRINYLKSVFSSQCPHRYVSNTS